MKTNFLLMAFFCIGNFCAGQTGTSPDSINISYGEVTRHDFMIRMAGADSNADAIVLSDVGRTVLEGYAGGYRILFTRSRKMRLMNKRSFEAATIHLKFSIEDNGGRKLKDLKACTYNFENGRIAATPLTDKEIFIDNSNGDLAEEKFTFPNVKEGTVIEYTYTLVSSDYFNLYPWYFQGGYPTLFSIYSVDIPDIFNYVFLIHGTAPPVNNDIDSTSRILYAGNTAYTTHIHTTTWNATNVPSIKEEPFTSTLDNFISGVKFQILAHPVKPGLYRNVLGSWQSACNQLLASDRFGIPILGKEKKLKEFTDKLVVGSTASLDRARKIFAFVRDNFEADQDGVLLSSGMTLEKIFQKKAGSVADINLLLIAMLRCEKIQADPVILSTRENGLPSISYPIIDDFNYVVCKTTLGDTAYYLDASAAKIGFGKLPAYCYNGPARAIANTSYLVYFQPDSLTETKTRIVSIINKASDSLSAAVLIDPGYFESLKIREGKNSQGALKNYLDKEFKKLPFEYKLLAAPQIDSFNQYDQSVVIHYNIAFKLADSNIVYFTPMLNTAITENPLKSSERSYPLEMPYRNDETYILDMEIPKGYIVEELPKSVSIKLDKDGLYEYEISLSNDHLKFKSKLVFNKAIFNPEEYQALRDFFTAIIKKQSEMVVFRKN